MAGDDRQTDAEQRWGYDSRYMMIYEDGDLDGGIGGLQRRQNRRFEVGGPAVKDEPAYARSFSGAGDSLYDKDFAGE